MTPSELGPTHMEWERQCHRWDSFPRPELTTTEHLFPAHWNVPLHTQQGPTSPQEITKVSGQRGTTFLPLAQCPTCELLQHRSKVTTCNNMHLSFLSPNTPAFSQAAVAMLTQIHVHVHVHTCITTQYRIPLTSLTQH